MTLILVDLEGCLSDHTERLHTLQEMTQADPKDRTAWKEYYKGLLDDEPREYVLYAVKTWIREEATIVIYSTRFQNKYRHEEEWLRGHELWDHIELLQRTPTETGIKGPMLVAEWAGTMQPDILVDDREEVRELVKSTSPKITVLGPDDFIRRQTA